MNAVKLINRFLEFSSYIKKLINYFKKKGVEINSSNVMDLQQIINLAMQMSNEDEVITNEDIEALEEAYEEIMNVTFEDILNAVEVLRRYAELMSKVSSTMKTVIQYIPEINISGNISKTSVDDNKEEETTQLTDNDVKEFKEIAKMFRQKNINSESK